MGQEIEDRNPLWIKEKGDNFFINRDFRSAVNAYNRAIEIDPDFQKCYLNRATAYLNLGEFQNSINDLEKIHDLIISLPTVEKEDQFFVKLLIKIYAKLYASYALIDNFDKSLEIIDKLLTKENQYILDDKTTDKISKDRTIIQIRKTNEIGKILGDECLKNGDFTQAKSIYISLLEKEPLNEKILSNLSLISLNQEDYHATIEYCNEVLKIVKKFKEKIYLNPKIFDNSFELKILLRRAKSNERIGEMDKAQEDIESIERLEIRNNCAFKDIDDIKAKLKEKVLENYRISANELLEKKQFTEALQFYDKSLSLSRHLPKIDQIKLLLNRCSCLIALGQCENVNNDCIKIIASLEKQRNIAIINSNQNLIKQIKDLEFLTYVKSAYSYSKSNKNEEAKNDYKMALKINPDDIRVKQNLAKLN